MAKLGLKTFAPMKHCCKSILANLFNRVCYSRAGGNDEQHEMERRTFCSSAEKDRTIGQHEGQ
jgi:hypothetical protein